MITKQSLIGQIHTLSLVPLESGPKLCPRALTANNNAPRIIPSCLKLIKHSNELSHISLLLCLPTPMYTKC